MSICLCSFYNSVYQCLSVSITEWSTSAVDPQLQSRKRQSSSLFNVSSLPWSQHKSSGLFGAGGDSPVSKPGEFYILLKHLYTLHLTPFHVCTPIIMNTLVQSETRFLASPWHMLPLIDSPMEPQLKTQVLPL